MDKHKSKIGIIHYTYPPAVGGVENLIRTHALYFCEHGYKVTIFSSVGQENHQAIRMVQIPELASLKLTEPDLYTKMLSTEEFPDEIIRVSETIFQQLEKQKNTFEILIAHNIFSLALNPAIALALLTFHAMNPDIPIVAWTHDLIFQDRETNPTRQKFPNKKLDEIIHTPQNDISYVVISQFLKDNLVRILDFKDDRLTVIPNCLDMTRFLGLHKITKKIVKKHSLLDFNCILYFPSKIMPHKNYVVCLEALHQLIKHGLNPVMIFSAGVYPHSKQAQKHIQLFHKIIDSYGLSNNIAMVSEYFSGQKPDDIFRAIREIYMLSDIVLYPSQYENFGLPILECAVTKTPIICTDLPVFIDLAGDRLYQIKKNNLNEHSLSKLITQVLSESKQSRLLQRVKQKFLIETVFKKNIIPYIDSL